MTSSSSLTIRVGTATCGRSVGALEVLEAVRAEISQLNLGFDVVEVGCIGHCYAEPILLAGDHDHGFVAYGYLDKVSARAVVRDLAEGTNLSRDFIIGAVGADGAVISEALESRNWIEKRIVLSNCGILNPRDIKEYVARKGYQALEQSLSLQQEELLALVDESGLRGRGGAGYPTGKKWRACQEALGSIKYIICNADEGDPGAFMDRSILESDPHSVIEGMTIAARAVGATKGIVYVRAEYPLAAETMRVAICQAREAGYLGESAFGGRLSFDIEVFEAAGAFVCGEETALIASLEGKRGVPRPKPPYPSTSGLQGVPTVIDNVKTLATVRHIVLNGAQWFRSYGSQGSPGTAVFALAGKTTRPGLVEVPMGSTLRQVVFDVGGGVLDPNYARPGSELPTTATGFFQMRALKPKQSLKCIQIGGPSGGCIPESLLDLPIDFDSLENAGAMMGSGGLVVMADDDCVVETARYFLEFTQRESCGRCRPCRVGTKRMLDLLNRITEGEGCEGDLDTLLQMAEGIKRQSACNLGRTAPNPVISALRYFRDEFEAHLDQRCPALVCKSLISYEFDVLGCASSCEQCSVVCDAITSHVGYDGVLGRMTRSHQIDDELCTRCAVCVDSCAGANHVAVHKVTPAKRTSKKNLRESFDRNGTSEAELRLSGAEERHFLLESPTGIDVDEHKCVLCGRCIRACSKTGNSFLTFAGRGLGTWVQPVMSSAEADSICRQCCACVDACPADAISCLES